LRTSEFNPGLEALRLLTNHHLDTKSRFATVLLGQPTLAAKIGLGVLAALEQRITVRRTMTGMTNQENRRNTSATTNDQPADSPPLFTDDALAQP